VTDYAGTGGLTVRNVIRPTVAGKAIRIRLSNRYGSMPVSYDDVTVAPSAGGPALTTDPAVKVTFAGNGRVTIPIGQTVTSDRIHERVGFGRLLAVDLYSAGPTGTTTTSPTAPQTSYISQPGDHAADADPSAYTSESHSFYSLDRVDVLAANPRAATAVALGSSTTAGTGSTIDSFHSWPDLLADRLHRRLPKSPTPVVNSGIPGNTLHESSACYGDSAMTRLGRDALRVSGARYLMLVIGSNDITQPTQPATGIFGPCLARTPISAADLTKLYKQVIARAHSRGLKAFAATISPFGAYQYWSPAIEAERTKINHWLLTRSKFDAVFDFSAAVEDPANPTRLLPAFDSGDGLHPNDSGYQAQANSIPLSVFRR
jgi:lysophospholipase L1-like esterase